VTKEVGKTLRQTIPEAKPKAKTEKRKLGSSFWKSVRMRFACPSGPCTNMKVNNVQQVVRSSLLGALRIANSSNTTVRNRQHLLERLAHVGKPNQRELVGLFKAALQVTPSNSQSCCNFAVAIGRFIARHKLEDWSGPEVDVMRHHIDAALVACWASLKKKQRTSRWRPSGVATGVWPAWC